MTEVSVARPDARLLESTNEYQKPPIEKKPSRPTMTTWRRSRDTDHTPAIMTTLKKKVIIQSPRPPASTRIGRKISSDARAQKRI